MPRPVIPRPLYQLALARCARNVHTGLKALDQLWQARPRRHPELGSPAGSPHNLSTAQLLPPDSPSPAQTAQSQLHHDLARELRDWLTQPPHHLAQDLVEAIIVLIEESVNEDRDRKLIKSLINIEHLKVSDIFFGIHGFFTIVSGTSVTKLPFGAAEENVRYQGCKCMRQGFCLPGLKRMESEWRGWERYPRRASGKCKWYLDCRSKWEHTSHGTNAPQRTLKVSN
eukprot:maker-scaffold1103_size62544-snap-gene-0.12 protein:Tk04263 transcript:maker-scaffold1103_size62544-snap-gene-0.12-mRNA-1 annotation:"angiopoietin-2 isoform x1"